MKILYEVDVQYDFMYSKGEFKGLLPVTDAEGIIPNIERLVQYAGENRIPIVGSMDKHFGTPEYASAEVELQRNGGDFPDHCMVGTIGAGRLDQIYSKERITTLVPNVVPGGEKSQFSLDRLNRFYGNYPLVDIFFEKQTIDVFTNAYFKDFLKFSGIDEAIVYGVATDHCVRAAVLGMQERGVQCYVVEDAVKGIDEEGSKLALEEMVRAGAKLTTTDNVLDNI